MIANRFQMIAQCERRHLEAPLEGVFPDFGNTVTNLGLLQCRALIKSIPANGLYRVGDGDALQTAFAEG